MLNMTQELTILHVVETVHTQDARAGHDLKIAVLQYSNSSSVVL